MDEIDVRFAMSQITPLMTIQDYIKKHELTLWRKWPNPLNKFPGEWTPSVFITHVVDGKAENFPHDETIEIYSNAEKTRFVAMNVSRRVFRIVHHELIMMESNWEPANVNFVLQGIL